MEIFIDTANINEITLANNMGIISGVTTNPSLIAKEGKDFIETVKEITNIVDGPISAEVISTKTNEMISEAHELAEKIKNKNLVIKIPMTSEGLSAVSVLSKEGIRTNVTLIFTPSQALLAARAGATYVSPFMGRLDDYGKSGTELVSDISSIFKLHNIPTKIIAASIRNPKHAEDAAKAGADIATIPYAVIMEMTKHALTDSGIERFLKDWEGVN